MDSGGPEDNSARHRWKFTLLKRSAPSQSDSGTEGGQSDDGLSIPYAAGDSAFTPLKTHQQRQQEYDKARVRIFGVSTPPTEEPEGSGSDAKPVVKGASNAPSRKAFDKLDKRTTNRGGSNQMLVAPRPPYAPSSPIQSATCYPLYPTVTYPSSNCSQYGVNDLPDGQQIPGSSSHPFQTLAHPLGYYEDDCLRLAFPLSNTDPIVGDFSNVNQSFFQEECIDDTHISVAVPAPKRKSKHEMRDPLADMRDPDFDRTLARYVRLDNTGQCDPCVPFPDELSYEAQFPPLG